MNLLWQAEREVVVVCVERAGSKQHGETSLRFAVFSDRWPIWYRAEDPPDTKDGHFLRGLGKPRLV
jgi:hypothetical protein